MDKHYYCGGCFDIAGVTADNGNIFVNVNNYKGRIKNEFDT